MMKIVVVRSYEFAGRLKGFLFFRAFEFVEGF